jgi:hypothetical protein
MSETLERVLWVIVGLLAFVMPLLRSGRILARIAFRFECARQQMAIGHNDRPPQAGVASAFIGS